MINWRELARDQVFFAMENGEFESSIAGSGKNVAIILSQDWCPQWEYLKSNICSSNKDVQSDVDIYFLLYNRVEYFSDFLNFKETVWNNDLIPYIRYYKHGKLIHTSNFVYIDEFFEKFKI